MGGGIIAPDALHQAATSRTLPAPAPKTSTHFMSREGAPGRWGRRDPPPLPTGVKDDVSRARVRGELTTGPLGPKCHRSHHCRRRRRRSSARHSGWCARPAACGRYAGGRIERHRSSGPGPARRRARGREPFGCCNVSLRPSGWIETGGCPADGSVSPSPSRPWPFVSLREPARGAELGVHG